jgi:hypothetical protein
VSVQERDLPTWAPDVHWTSALLRAARRAQHAGVTDLRTMPLHTNLACTPQAQDVSRVYIGCPPGMYALPFPSLPVHSFRPDPDAPT